MLGKEHKHQAVHACIAAWEEAGSAEEAAEPPSAPAQDALLLLSMRSVCSSQGLPLAGQAPHHPDPAAPSNHRLCVPQADRYSFSTAGP